MGEIAGTSPDRVGARLHALRAERGLTLARLAEVAGLTRGYLSLLERDLKRPSLAALVRIADALETEVSSLFGEQSPPEARYVLYRHQRSPNGPQSDGPQTVPLAASRAGKVMEPFFLMPSFRPVKRVTHSGEELIVVLSGEVLVRLGGEEVTLKANDSLYFTASVDHQLQSLGASRAHVLVVISRNRGVREVIDAVSSRSADRTGS